MLSQTDLYLLKTELLLNPVFANAAGNFHLVFNIATGMSSPPRSECNPDIAFVWRAGQTGGFNPQERERDLPFVAKDEPATLPRVSELVIITDISPWCTIVRNERGVTMSDVCTTIWKE